MARKVYFVVSCGIALCTVLFSCSLGMERRQSGPSSTETTEESDGFLWKIFSKGREFLNSFQSIQHQNKASNDPHRIISGQRLDGIPEEIYGDLHQPEHREVTKYNPQEHAYNHYDSNYMGHTQTTKVVYRGDNMELYSLLGGLSFASLLATTLIILTRRNGTLLRSNDAFTISRNADSSGLSPTISEPYEVRLKIPKALVKMGKLLWRRPWWSGEGRSSSGGMKTFNS